jgi:hypothetical protein
VKRKSLLINDELVDQVIKLQTYALRALLKRNDIAELKKELTAMRAAINKLTKEINNVNQIDSDIRQ